MASPCLTPRRFQCAAQPTSLGQELGISELPAFAALAFPEDRRVLTATSPHVAIDAMTRQVNFAAEKPARPRNAPARVIQRVEWTVEFDSEVVNDGVPEPGDIRSRSSDKLPVIADVMPGHETPDVRAGDRVATWLPDV